VPSSGVAQSRWQRRAGGLVRLGLLVLAAVNGGWGVWARFWPRGFFDTFPGFGHRWTAAYPPYNEHLITDLGATFLTLAFMLVAALLSQSRPVRRVVLAGVLLFDALHLSFHLTHHDGMAPVDVWASLGSLAAGVLAPAVLLALDWWSGPRRDRSDPDPA
jgi:hypothetical protein